MTQPSPEFSEIQDTINRLDTAHYPSEVHGTLCGLLCVKSLADALAWIESTFTIDPANLLQKEALEQLNNLCQSAFQQMQDPTFAFHLLLPDDDAAIDDRIQCLGDWCQGFLTGLTMGGISNLQAMPQDAIEIATDMAEIARAGSSYDFTDSEEDEAAYQELVEYIRVGALLINEELQSGRHEVKNDSTLH